jgi:hypothetical protein
MLKSATLACLLAAGILFPGQAIGYDQITVKFPGKVKIQERVLEPGEYVIRQMSATGGPRDVLGIYKDGGLRLETIVLTIPAMQTQTPESTKVVFHRIGTDHYFDKIWIQGKNYGYEFPLPERLRSRLKEMKQSDVEASHQEVDREGKPQDEAKKPS